MAAARKGKAPQQSAAEGKPKDNGRAGIQPSTRVFATWTPAAIRSAESSAESGYLAPAANLTEWILRDDRVQGALGARVDALLGLDPSFTKSGDKRRSGRAIRALEVQEDWWDSYPEAESGLVLRWGIVLGIGPARHAWDAVEGHDGRILPLPEFWHPQHLRYDWPTRRWLARVQTGLSGGTTEVEAVPGDGDWLFHRPYGRARPWAWGSWHGLAPLVLLKELARQDRSRAGEKGALLVGTIEEGVNVATDTKPAHVVRRELAEELHRRGRDGVCILPAGFDLKMVQLAAGLNEIYEAQIKMANEAIAINIRGGNLTTDTKGGSLAAAEAQERTGDQSKLRSDAQAWTTTIHDQSLVWWAEFNFGDRNLAPWPVYPVATKKDLKKVAEAGNSALDAAKKAKELGFKIKRDGFIEEFEFDAWLEEGEEPPAPTPTPPGTPPAPGVPGTPPPPPAPNPPEPDRPKGGKASALSRFRLASGDSLRKGRGFVDGQLYTDALTENATEDGIAALEPTMVAILEELDAATDYDDLRARLRARYAELDPEEISDIISAAMTLGDLAGRVAVNQDA